MGVSRLWDILQPVATHCPLTALKGKTLAVDLGGWVCQNTFMKASGSMRKPHLRNLFFRVSCLLRAGVKLIFVTEGVMPDLKEEVLSQRIASQYGSKSATGGGLTKPNRNKFDSVLRECQEMLESLGVACIQSSGEAEAMCAYLNMKGVVDGCISDDGDCFLYGGLVVYRNFTMDVKDPHVEMYSMEDIDKRLNLDRRKLVALALLLGCDYGLKGVLGIGKELALKFLKRLDSYNVDPLQRFEDWKTKDMFSSLKNKHARFVKKSSHCNNCKHPGTNKRHEKSGCAVCQTEISCNMSDSSDCACEWHKNEKLKEEWGVELKVMEKALALDNFPNRGLIKEFLMYKDKLPQNMLEWDKPNLILFQEFMSERLGWVHEYSAEKAIPLLSLWHLTHRQSGDATLQLVKIVKTKVYKGIPCFEVEWKTQSDEVVVLIEPRDLVQTAYHDLVEQFLKETDKKNKKVDGRGKITKAKTKKKCVAAVEKMVPKVSIKNDAIVRERFDTDLQAVKRAYVKPSATEESSKDKKEVLQNEAKKEIAIKQTSLNNWLGLKPCKDKQDNPSEQTKRVSLPSSDSDDDFLPLTQRLAQTRQQDLTNVDKNINLQTKSKKEKQIPTRSLHKTTSKPKSCFVKGSTHSIEHECLPEKCKKQKPIRYFYSQSGHKENVQVFDEKLSGYSNKLSHKEQHPKNTTGNKHMPLRIVSSSNSNHKNYDLKVSAKPNVQDEFRCASTSVAKISSKHEAKTGSKEIRNKLLKPSPSTLKHSHISKNSYERFDQLSYAAHGRDRLKMDGIMAFSDVICIDSDNEQSALSSKGDDLTTCIDKLANKLNRLSVSDPILYNKTPLNMQNTSELLSVLPLLDRTNKIGNEQVLKLDILDRSNIDQRESVKELSVYDSDCSKDLFPDLFTTETDSCDLTDLLARDESDAPATHEVIYISSDDDVA